MTRIRDDLEQPDSRLVRHGEQRLQTLGNVSRTLEETLKQLGNVIDAHKPAATRDGTLVRRFWGKLRWKQEQSRSIAKLRMNLGFSLTSLQLVLASLGK
jgi:hypothetical protein